MKHSFANVFPKTQSLVFLLLLCIMSSIASTASASSKGMEVHDAWVRETPPNATVMAAYLTLQNHSAKSFTLVSASSPDFKRVEIHRTEQQDGMTKMLPVSRVMLSPNGSVNFQPGGMHLMLMKPKKRFKVGDSISLTLFFTNESSLKISAPVKRGTGIGGHEMHHENHHDMHKSGHPSSHDMHDKKDHHNSHNH